VIRVIGHREWYVVDRTTGEVVHTCVSEEVAEIYCKRLNDGYRDDLNSDSIDPR